MCDPRRAGSNQGIINAVNWIVNHNDTRCSRKVINMSLGGSLSSAINAAVAKASSSGVVVVAAAGNEAQNACNVSPASVPVAITVGATSTPSGGSDPRASYSNYGSCVDVVRPHICDAMRHGSIILLAPRCISPLPSWISCTISLSMVAAQAFLPSYLLKVVHTPPF